MGCNNQSIPQIYSTGVAYKDSTEVLTNKGWKLNEPAMPFTVHQHCMVVINSTTVMIIGGRTSNQIYYSDETYYYNFETKEWSQGPHLIIARVEHDCGMVRTDKDSDEVETIRPSQLFFGPISF